MDPPVSTVEGRKTQSGGLTGLSFNTLRGRFFLVLFVVLLPSLTVFGVLHHDLVKRALLEEVNESLVERSIVVGTLLQTSEIETNEDFQKLKLKDSPLGVDSAPEVYVDIVTSEGTTLWTSDNLSGGTIPMTLGEDAAVKPGFSTVSTKDGLRLRTLTRTQNLRSGLKVHIVVAESLLHLESALQASIGRSVLLGGLILVLTELVGSWALRGVFAPLEHLAETAESIAVTDDVTQRVPIEPSSQEEIRRTAIAFNSLMERVEHLLEMAKRLLADTSHELRNPLTVLLTDLDLLRNELSADQREEVVQESQATVRRMARLVSDLLLLSRAEAHSEQVVTENVDVQAFVSKVVKRLSDSLPGAERVTMVGAPSGNEVTGVLNRERTEQIITNLVENAVRYTVDEKVDVSVRAEDEQVVVSVKDYGSGIPVEEQEHIFARFYRLDPSRNRHSGGTGLGLPLARALARDQGGNITVSSTVGQGADFSLYLPRAVPSGSRNV